MQLAPFQNYRQVPPQKSILGSNTIETASAVRLSSLNVTNNDAIMENLKTSTSEGIMVLSNEYENPDTVIYTTIIPGSDLDVPKVSNPETLPNIASISNSSLVSPDNLMEER